MSIYKLYKFREVNTNSLASLANAELWFSSKEDFNDPFEGMLALDETLDTEDFNLGKANIKWSMDIDPSDQKFIELCEKLSIDPVTTTEETLMAKGLSSDLQVLIKLLHQSKLLCLSQKDSNVDPIYENLMWSHYAQGLRGFCLVFNNDSLQHDINDSCPSGMRAIKIKYQDVPDKLSLKDYLRSDMWIRQKDQNYIQKVTETVATKSRAWSYENEVRLMALDPDISVYPYSVSTLEEVVFGEKMPNQHKQLLLSILKSNYPHVKIKTARLMPSTFNLEIVDGVA